MQNNFNATNFFNAIDILKVVAGSVLKARVKILVSYETRKLKETIGTTMLY